MNQSDGAMPVDLRGSGATTPITPRGVGVGVGGGARLRLAVLLPGCVAICILTAVTSLGVSLYLTSSDAHGFVDRVLSSRRQCATALGISLAASLLVVGLFAWASPKLRVLRALARTLEQAGRVGRDIPAEQRHELLQLDERFGPEALAFNELIRPNATVAAGMEAPAAAERRAGSSERASAEMLSEIEHAVNILPSGVLLLSRDGAVRKANNIGALLAGANPASIEGKNLAELLPDPAMLTLMESLQQGHASRKAIEVRRQTELGEAVLRVQCRPLRKDDVAGAVIVLDDVTQQRQADASRGLFIAQATHELRMPLTNMRLAIETVMDEEVQLPPNLTPHLNMLSGEVRRLERMVSDMLAVSEIEAGSLKLTRGEVQIERLCTDIEADHKPHAAEKSIEFGVSLPPKLPRIYGDREKLAQALHNLVGNAIKYTGNGGSVKITVSESADGKFLSFAVSDTGFGISPEDQSKLFNRFARGSDPRVAKITGTGLGLSLSREIARLHGGDIVLTSELNKGSTFTLNVPIGRSEQRLAA